MISPRFAHVVLLLAVCAVANGLEERIVRADDDASRKPVAGSESAFATTVQPFLKSYCASCHGAKKQKGERRFDTLAADISDDNALVDFQDILDQLNLSEMPPKEARQPSDDERQEVVRWLTSRVERYHEQHQHSGRETVLRRMNSREYRNTVRDLLQLNMTMFDPTSTFPKDQTTEQLDNVGATLVTSGYLLARYLEAAEQVIDRALLPIERPPLEKWVFRDGFRQQPEIDQVHRKTNDFEHMTLYDVIGADKHEGAYGPILAFKEGVPFDGVYEIRLKAEAVNRVHPYDPKFLGTDPDEPLRLGIVPGNYLAGQLHKPQPIEPLLAEVELADESKWYTVRVWLDAGYTPRFTFRNGLMDARTLWSQLLKKYPSQFPKRKRGGIVENRYNAIAHGKLPQIHIHEIEIQGPLFETWPTSSQRALLGDDCASILNSGALTTSQMREVVTTFLSRAYRRPARTEDVDRILRVVALRGQAGRSSLEALSDGLKAALCSPNFVYLEQAEAATDSKDPASESQLSSFALASRLSYFLWSSMPDDELRELAASGAIKKTDVLEAQVLRMLGDKKSDAFVDGFLDSWLNLRELGSTPPDRDQFGEFYHYDLGTAMRRETFLFTRHLIDEDLDIVHFLDSDFTFANQALAKLYDIAPPEGRDFERVHLDDRRRGGLLGQASVLTLTANGIDTSPVVRGVWMLENLLGTPPSPPPPDVEPLDPDIRGAKTIRDQLRKHRSVASCNDCHRKIDPLGFALENFDPIGKWRDSYSRQAKVDASGELPSGATFDDIDGFKPLIVAQKDQFTRALAEKLLAYASGRHLTPRDRPHVDSVLAELHNNGDGMRTLIRAVVLSQPFRSK